MQSVALIFIDHVAVQRAEALDRVEIHVWTPILLLTSCAIMGKMLGLSFLLCEMGSTILVKVKEGGWFIMLAIQ